MSQTAVLIYGAGDFGHLLKSQLPDSGLGFAGFIDDTSKDPRKALTLEQAVLDPKSLQTPLVCAIGYNNLKARKIAYSRALGLGFRLCTLIHPQAYVPNRLNVGVGSIVMARATIDATAEIHTAVVVWPGVVVSHDCVVEENTFLSHKKT